MSGTSADGINVALVQTSEARELLNSRGRRPMRSAGQSKALRPHAGQRFRYLAHAQYPYPKNVRRAVLKAMNAQQTSVAELARLNFLLGELYADAVLSSQRRFRLRAELVGCHGQTLYHQGERKPFLGRKLAVTWQTGEAAAIAAHVGVPVVSDFRPADMVAGGKGAPLVPFLDYLVYRDEYVGRIIQNIGGIANLTAIRPAARPDQVLAFDTGPGNMLIDAVTDRLFGKPYDDNGKIAASGVVLQNVIDDLFREPFFRRKPPKTAGREEFGREFLETFLRRCRGSRKQDMVATATALTAQAVADAIRRFVIPKDQSFREVLVSGGGTENPTLMAVLANSLKPMRLELRFSDEFGLPSEAKEAAAFALMAYETWNRRPSNVPSATGARRAAVLGKISYP
jgi:anhydro-N-acetylmuramic acid kinase